MKKIVVIALVALSFSALSVPFADAGRQGGAGKDAAICEARGSVTYHVTFWGGEQARVAIVGDGSSDLDLFVYDMSGRLVAQGIGLTDTELVSFTPNQTQTYRIVVRNLDNVWNRYSMATN